MNQSRLNIIYFREVFRFPQKSGTQLLFDVFFLEQVPHPAHDLDLLHVWIMHRLKRGSDFDVISKWSNYFYRAMNFKVNVYLTFRSRSACTCQEASSSTFKCLILNYLFQVALVPCCERTFFRTPVQRETSCPQFNQSFSFQLQPEDLNKRILVSVWHRDRDNR